MIGRPSRIRQSRHEHDGQRRGNGGSSNRDHQAEKEPKLARIAIPPSDAAISVAVEASTPPLRRTSHAVTTVDSAIRLPTERSMPPVRSPWSCRPPRWPSPRSGSPHSAGCYLQKRRPGVTGRRHERDIFAGRCLIRATWRGTGREMRTGVFPPKLQRRRALRGLPAATIPEVSLPEQAGQTFRERRTAPVSPAAAAAASVSNCAASAASASGYVPSVSRRKNAHSSRG